MLLSARMLTDVQNVNSFEYVDQVEFFEGDTLYLYFQLTDSTQNRVDQGYMPAGRRYVPASGSTLQVILDNIDDAKRVSRAATLAFPNLDNSIWKVQVLANDKISGTVQMKLMLSESGTTKNALIKGAVRIYSQVGP